MPWTKGQWNAIRRAYFAGWNAGVRDRTANANTYHPGHTSPWNVGYFDAYLYQYPNSRTAWKTYRRMLKTTLEPK